jgi:hypothetical protein
MRRQNAEWLRWRYVRCFYAIGLMLGGILLITASGDAGVLTASWIAPTTNTDGRQLTELALYRIYYSTSDSPCPGSTFFEAASSTSMPPPNQLVSFQMMGLTTGSIYSVSVTAVDTHGNESACSDAAIAIAQDDSAITPTAPDASSTTPLLQDGSTTTPERFCPPGQAKKGRC